LFSKIFECHSILYTSRTSVLGSSSMRTKITLEHVVYFGDAIFAFSITFMAVLIEIPNLPANLSQTEVIQSLVEDLGPRFAVYVISFFVIGLCWISYHQNFQPYRRFWWGNSMVKPCILILHNHYPFCCWPSSRLWILSGHIHALVLTFGGLTLTLIWLHARKNRLIDNTVSHTEIQNVLLFFCLLSL